jgi:hypothetical protein
LAGTLLTTHMRIAIAALALLMLLASGFHVCQSRPDKFAVHGTSSKQL